MCGGSGIVGGLVVLVVREEVPGGRRREVVLIHVRIAAFFLVEGVVGLS